LAVITISRQFGSHGDTVAQVLCDRLGYRYFDKNLMMGLAARAGVAPDKVVDLSDEKHRTRSLLERLFGNYAAPMADPASWAAGAAANAEEQLTADRLKSLIRAAHAQGDVVILGRGGQVVLRDQPDVLHVRIIAPLEKRVREHQARAGLSAEAAREQVLNRDRASLDFVNRYYDVDAADPQFYDLVLNTARLTPVDAVDMIIEALGHLPA
jgi:cytidylate kinase